MSEKHKLVPVEPTPEMLEAGADWCGQGLGTYEAKGRAATAYKFMLAAAPDVQGEPVAWIRKWSLDGEKPTKERNKNGRMAYPMKHKLHEVTRNRCLPDDVALYAAQQPAEQQTPTHWSHDNPGLADQYRAEALAARRSLGFEQDAYDVAPTDIAAAIESLTQPAPDVTRLVEALETVMWFGCNPNSKRGMWALEKANSALAAYRNQGGDT